MFNHIVIIPLAFPWWMESFSQGMMHTCRDHHSSYQAGGPLVHSRKDLCEANKAPTASVLHWGNANERRSSFQQIGQTKPRVLRRTPGVVYLRDLFEAEGTCLFTASRCSWSQITQFAFFFYLLFVRTSKSVPSHFFFSLVFFFLSGLFDAVSKR